MSKVAKVAGIPLLPSNMKVVSVDGKQFIQKRTRSRRKFKLSKEQRNKISAAAKRFKIPVVTGLILAPSVLAAGEAVQANGGLGNARARRLGLNEIYSSFVPVVYGPGWKPTFMAGNLMRGLLPLGMLFFAKKLRLFRGQQRQVSQASGGVLSLT